MTDFPMTADLRAILVQPDVRAWMLEHVKQGVAPAWGADDLLCLRFDDDQEAEAFRARWL